MEFALAVPAFLLLLMGLFDLGRVVYAQHTITQDAREGARKGQVSPAFSTAKYDVIRDAALVMSPGVGLERENITGRPGVDCPVVDLEGSGSCFYPFGIDPGLPVEVNISVDVPLLTPIISQIVGGFVTVTAQSIGEIQ